MNSFKITLDQQKPVSLKHKRQISAFGALNKYLVQF